MADPISQEKMLDLAANFFDRQLGGTVAQGQARNGRAPHDATLIRSVAQLEAFISDVNLTCGTAQQATAPPYGSWPARRLL
jgi:hypothetical protein